MMHWKGFLEEKLRVLTKFQVDLVIPKHIYGYISTKRRGYVYKGDF